MKKINLIIILFLAFSFDSSASGWVKKKGQGYYKLSARWMVFDQHYTDAGLLDPNLTMGLFNMDFYAEHGLGKNITGILSVPLFSRNYMNNLVSINSGDVLVEGEAINSFGDIDIG